MLLSSLTVLSVYGRRCFEHALSTIEAPLTARIVATIVRDTSINLVVVDLRQLAIQGVVMRKQSPDPALRHAGQALARCFTLSLLV